MRTNETVTEARKLYATRRAAVIAEFDGITKEGFDALARSYATECADGERIEARHWLTASLMLSKDIDLETVAQLRRYSEVRRAA